MLTITSAVRGHDIPSQLPDPQSPDEAWNVIEGSASNIDRLFDAGLFRDFTFQIANTDGSLLFLISHADSALDPQIIRGIATQLLSDGSDLIACIRDPAAAPEKIKLLWAEYRKKAGDLGIKLLQ